MAQQTIDIGSAPNDGTGDPIRDAFDKCNDNFTELYGSLAGLLDFQGATDCSANPNYPAASQGDIYIVSVAGKIGGASGKTVEVGDFYLALADNAGGTEASVGTSWAVLQANITGGSVISELDDIPDVNAPTPSNGQVLTWDSTPGEWIAQDLPAAGAFVLDDATDVDAPAPNDGDVLTWVDADNEWQAVSPGAASGAWTLAGTGQTATGVYDFAVDGAKANIDFTGLGSFNELLVIARGLSDGTNGNRLLRVSVDNGSTFYSASGDYVTISNAGVETNTTLFGGHGTATTAARSFITHILNMKGPAKASIDISSTGNQYLFVASSSDIDAIRVTNSGGGNITAGTVRVYAR